MDALTWIALSWGTTLALVAGHALLIELRLRHARRGAERRP
jgi:hypothetical protein